MTKPHTLRECRRRLNQIEHWLRRNPHFFRPTHLVLLRSVLEDAALPGHVETLQGYMREWMLSDAEAEAQKATTDEAIRQAEEARAAAECTARSRPASSRAPSCVTASPRVSEALIGNPSVGRR